jgi:glycosyltransferase involved in cell wall biosynthesis
MPEESVVTVASQDTDLREGMLEPVTNVGRRQRVSPLSAIKNGQASLDEIRISVVVPTLNEEHLIERLLESLDGQDYAPLETIVVDGGSRDRTLEIARRFGARTFPLPSVKEFPSMNYGARKALGNVLLFTGADAVFPRDVLARIASRFSRDRELVAVAGPGFPVRPPLLFGLEFTLYNWARFIASRLPRPSKRFSTSTNLLAVRNRVFKGLGGLGTDPINADGMLGAKLCQAGKVHFSFREIRCYMSDRRLRSMGFIRFNMHYLYVLENFFPQLGQFTFMSRLKEKSAASHSRQNGQ